MPIDRTNKIAFCHIPRTGGVSVCNALNLEVIEKHEPASWYRKNFPDYFLFTIKRDYDDRVLSAFGGEVPEDKSSWQDVLSKKDYMGKDKQGNARLMLLPNEHYMDAPVDFVIDYKHLQRDFNKMLKMLKLPKVKLNKENSFK